MTLRRPRPRRHHRPGVSPAVKGWVYLSIAVVGELGKGIAGWKPTWTFVDWTVLACAVVVQGLVTLRAYWDQSLSTDSRDKPNSTGNP